MKNIVVKNTLKCNDALKASYTFFNGHFHSFRVEKGNIIHTVSKDGINWEETYSSLNTGHEAKHIEISKNGEHLFALTLVKVIDKNVVYIYKSKDSVNWIRIEMIHSIDLSASKILWFRVMDINDKKLTLIVKCKEGGYKMKKIVEIPLE